MRGGAVAYGEHFYIVFFNKPLDDILRLNCFFMRRGRINNARIKHLSRLADYRNLTSCSVSRVKSDGNISLNRRLHKKLSCILGKHLYRCLARLFGQFVSYLSFD